MRGRVELTSEGERQFQVALAVVLRLEGGYADDPRDPGGRTNYGITQATYDAYRSSYGQPSLPVREISRDTVADIYRERYWLDGHCDLIAVRHPHMALAHFDAAVNCGIMQAARFLQRAVLVAADGVIGPVTLAAVERADDDRTTTEMLEGRAAFYRALVERRPASKVFLDGWLARLRWVARATSTPITAAFAKPGTTLH